MKYASLRALIAIALGIILAQTKIPVWWFAGIIVIIGLILAKPTRGFSLYLFLTLSAFLFTHSRNPWVTKDVTPINTFSGTVVSEPYGYHPRSAVLELTPPLEGKVILFLKDANSGLRLGDFIKVKGRIRPFDFPKNPGLVDYNQVMQKKGFIGRVTVRPNKITLLSRNHGNWFARSVVMPSRRFIFKTIEKLIGGDEGALLIGLLFGDKSGLPKKVQTSFTDSGLLHIMAVSGLNVGVVVGALILLLSVLRIRGWARFVISSLGALFYVALAGWTPAPARAGLMTTAALLSIPIQRRLTPLATLCFAGIILLFIEPNTLFDAGAQLSFTATAALLTFSPKAWVLLSRRKIPNWLRNYLLLPVIISLIATISTAPLLLHHFFRFQPLAFFSSVVVIPLVNLALPLGFLMLCLALLNTTTASILAETVRIISSLLLNITNWLARLDFLLIEPGKLSWVWVFWFYALLLLFLNWKNHWAKTLFRLGLAGGLVVFVWSGILTQPQTKITILDPGKGDALLLEDTLGRKILFDAGIDGTNVLTDFFRSEGIKRLDVAVVTHPDRDHYGGLLDLPERFRIDRLIVPTTQGDSLYQKLLNRYQLSGTEIVLTKKGGELQGFGYKIQFLLPDETTLWFYHQGLISTNPISLVALIEHKQFSFLLTGDCEMPEALTIALKQSSTAPVFLLKSPHHGSRKGNPLELFESLKPKYVIVLGRYPTPARLESILPEMGIKLINTRRDGGRILRFMKENPVWYPNL
ncbi:MAG: ComEC/Rec2 family competence protein [candidate division WOR-3 bacterium]